MKKMSILRWSIYLAIAAMILIAVRWLAAPVVAKTAPQQSLTTAQNSEWLVDLKKAQDEAKASHKLLLLNFTGSDWCGYCFQLDRAILHQQQFKDYASKNLVLLEVDFPRAKQQSRTLKEQNQRLAEEYQIEGFPTIVVLNGEGRKVWRYDGYFPDGPDAFIAALEKLRKG